MLCLIICEHALPIMALSLVTVCVNSGALVVQFWVGTRHCITGLVSLLVDILLNNSFFKAIDSSSIQICNPQNSLLPTQPTLEPPPLTSIQCWGCYPSNPEKRHHVPRRPRQREPDHPQRLGAAHAQAKGDSPSRPGLQVHRRHLCAAVVPLQPVLRRRLRRGHCLAPRRHERR